MTLPYLLCAIDLDDTLLTGDHILSSFTRETIRAIQNLGVKVVIASGRMYATTLPTVEELGLNTPVICYNGAMIRLPHTDEYWLNKRISAELTSEILNYAERNCLQLNFYQDDHIYTAAITDWAKLYKKRTGAPYEILTDYYCRLQGESPTKLIILDYPDVQQSRLLEMKQRFDGKLNVMRSNAEYLEFLPLGVDKGVALAITAEKLGISRSQTIAFGDSWNDISMLEWAGLGAAVNNAKPEVKSIADVISPSNDEDGVAHTLRDIFSFPHL